MPQTGGRPGPGPGAKEEGVGDMSSPVTSDNTQPEGNEASSEVESSLAARRRLPWRASAVAGDPDTDPENLLARALAVLECEQERWRGARSPGIPPGSRS
jgi:hypothetical protein